MRAATHRVLAAITLAFLVAGCTEETGGSPQTSGPSQPGTDVPKVANPLDAEPFLTNPCDLVAKSVVSEVGGTGAGKPDVNSDMAKQLGGPGCDWETEGGYFTINIRTVHRDQAAPHLKGIGSIYAAKNDPDLIEFRELEIPGHAGYPAVIARNQDDVDDGSCPVRVGIADDLTFIADMINEDNPDAACNEATKVAASVLDTLKKGA